ncbi:MAG: fibronectin type III domain-containing protein, partial [bacterium]
VYYSTSSSISPTNYDDFDWVYGRTTTNYTFTGLTNGTLYYFIITATDNSNNESKPSLRVSATPQDTTPPSAPTGLKATAGNNQVTLNWNANTESDCDGYYVYYSTSSSISPTNYDDFDWVYGRTTTNYTFTGLTNGTLYYFIVTATDESDNESEPSSTVNTTPQDIPPSTPTGLIATPELQQITLTWNANPEQDCDGYFVMMSRYSNITPTNYDEYHWVSGRLNTFYTFKGLSELIPYYFIVTATDYAGNESNASNVVSATPLQPQDTTPPSIPTNLTITNPAEDDGTHLNLTWTASTDNVAVAYYRVYESTSPNVSEEIYDAYYEPTTNSLQAYDLIRGVTYYYKVLAVDTSGNKSGLSNRASGIPKNTNPPAAPTNLSAVGYSNYISLSWDWSYDADGGHKIYRKPKGGVYQNIDQISFWNWYNDYNIVNGTTYYYKITALNEDGVEGPYSTEVEVTPQLIDTIPPASPKGLAVYPHDASAALEWIRNNESDLLGYNVYRNGVKVNPAIICQNYYSDTGLTNGVSYAYKITAVDIYNNESSYSEEKNIIPMPTLEITGFYPVDPTDPESGLFDPSISPYLTIYYTMSSNAFDKIILRIYKGDEIVYTETKLKTQDGYFTWNGKYLSGEEADFDNLTVELEGILSPAPQQSQHELRRLIGLGVTNVKTNPKNAKKASWNEFAAVDVTKTEDSDKFVEKMKNLGWVNRGYKKSTTPSPSLENCLRNAGESDQADILYISSHGSSGDGCLYYDSGDYLLSPEDIYFDFNNTWNTDLDWVIIAACSVLNIDSLAYGSPTEMPATEHGKRWAKTMLGNKGPVRGLFGYRWYSPGIQDDPRYADATTVVEKFINYLDQGKTFVDAWQYANLDVGRAMETWNLHFFDYAIITHTGHKDDHLPDKGTVRKDDDKGTSMYYWWCNYEIENWEQRKANKNTVKPQGPVQFSP